MKLAIINGSPRYKSSNSNLLINQFLKGYGRLVSDSVPVYYIAGKKNREGLADVFREAQIVIIIFPLYTDCMPGIVKEFFEDIVGLEYSHNKKIGFIVQSGFPESIHSMAVERYLKKFSERLKCEYLGCVIKGGVEGIQIMPPWMTRKLFSQFQELGYYFAQNSSFSPKVRGELQKPYKMSLAKRVGFTLFSKLGLTNFYWNGKLKENGAFKNSFDRPFI